MNDGITDKSYINEPQFNKFKAGLSHHPRSHKEMIEGVEFNRVVDDLTLKGQCEANNRRNNQLINDVKQYKRETDNQKKTYNKLIKEQEDLNNHLKLQIKDDLSDVKSLYNLNAYNNGDNLTGDDKLLNKMIDISLRNKQAIDNRMRLNSRTLLPYIEPEINIHEHSIWWDDETLEPEF